MAELLQTQAMSRMLEQSPRLALLKQFCCSYVNQCLLTQYHHTYSTGRDVSEIALSEDGSAQGRDGGSDGETHVEV